MSGSFPHPGEWPGHRRDGTLQSRSPAKGCITGPKLAWKRFVGTIDTLLEVEPEGTGGTLAVPVSPLADELLEPEEARWGLAPPLVELGGRLQPLERTWRLTYGHALPDEPDLQKFEFGSGFTVPTVNGQWQHTVNRCYAWRNGGWSQVWQTEPLYQFIPLPIFGDFDSDGNPEVVVLPWYDLVVLDARTGKVKDRCPITEGRSYGFLGVYDLSGDGKGEFVIQSDLAKHIDVIGYRDGKLSMLWRHAVELDISNPQKIMNVRPNPVGDVDGDGRPEVLVNVYNDLGDESWHITVHDGLTGEIKADVRDQFLNAIVDVDGDGVSELLTTGTSGRIVPAYGMIAAHRCRGGKPQRVWEKSGAAWQTWDPPLATNVNSMASQARRDVLYRCLEDRAVVVVREPAPSGSGHVVLSRMAWHGNGFRTESAITGPQAQALAMDQDQRLLIRCSTNPEESSQVKASRCRIRALGSEARGMLATTAIVAQSMSLGHPVVVVESADEQLVALDAPQKGKPGEILWRMPGRGQGWVQSWDRWDLLGPIAADLFGDGRRQVIYASMGPDGSARLVATDLTGEELWHHDFHNIPGTRPVQHFGGLLHWQVGHFSDPRAQDVLVILRRSAAHSEEAVLLSGADGRERWHRDRNVTRMHSRAIGGQPFAIADLDRDGLDEIATFHPSVFLTMKGATGESIISRDALWDEVPAKPVYWGVPIAGDFEGSGELGLFYGTWRGFMGSMTALLRSDATLVWWDALDTSPCCLPAIGDVDGDGSLEAVGIGYVDGIRCYDASTGQVKWRMPAPPEWYIPPPEGSEYPVGTASGDIDADGRDEVLFVVGNRLICIGVPAGKGIGELLWTLDFPTDIGPPSIADVDGKGHISVLVVGQDGYVYCVR